MYDVIVRGGTVVTAEGAEPLDVAIDGERIAAVEPPGALEAEAGSVLDADGLLVLPGGVDPHVHYSLAFGPVTAESQDWSPAAALGGTTTVVDFALAEPSVSLHHAIAAKKAEAEGRMAVDWALHAIVAGPQVAPDVFDEIADVVRGGIPTVKTFMTYGWMTDDGDRFGLMQATAAAGGMSVVHAEDDALAAFLTRRHLRDGKTHGAHIGETRGPLVEEAAVRRALFLAERAESPLYVLHMAAGSGVEALAGARARGLPVYGETLPLYLSFTAEDLWDASGPGLLLNNYPPVKHAEDRELLWQALADDRLQAVGTDHFGLTAEDRNVRMGTTVDALGAGHAAVELRLPLLFHLGVGSGRLGLARFVELVATNPAKLMGLFPRKGTIAVGADADLALLDPARSWTVRAEDLHTRADFSAWEGWEVTGKVVTTILRGAVVVADGRFVGAPAGGRFHERRIAPEILARPLDPRPTSVALRAPAPG